jgi:multiple sugar transport system substrate-binding protein
MGRLKFVALTCAAVLGGAGIAWADDQPACDGKLPAGTTNIKVSYQSDMAQAAVIQKLADQFNAMQSDVKVTIQVVNGLGNNYDNFVTGAVAANDLPQVLSADSAKALNYAWSGYLQPLDSCIPADLKADVPKSLLGEGFWAGKQWAISLVDTGVALYASKKALQSAGIRIPKGLDDAWTADEFDDALAKLRAAGFQHPLDMNKQTKGEFYPYAFLPIVWSAGGDMINRDAGGTTADGYLNTPAVVAAMTHFQNYYKNGYVDDNSDNNSMIAGRTPISWGGFWQYHDYKKALGDDLLALPLPAYGPKPAGAQGGWQFTITKGVDADAAWKWIAFVLQPENDKQVAEASSGVPARLSVLKDDPLYGPSGDLHVIADAIAGGYSKPRPPHPGYVTMSVAFAQAVQDIIDGKDVKSALDAAVKDIDDDLSANENYPAP